MSQPYRDLHDPKNPDAADQLAQLAHLTSRMYDQPNAAVVTITMCDSNKRDIEHRVLVVRCGKTDYIRTLIESKYVVEHRGHDTDLKGLLQRALVVLKSRCHDALEAVKGL